jgi:hypothetical protein
MELEGFRSEVGPGIKARHYLINKLKQKELEAWLK